jgi:polysaccharide export outer membrane protein
VLLFLSGCAPTTPHPRPSDTSTAAIEAPDTLQLERLAQIWQGRTQGGRVSDYPLGPGDVLEISVPAIEELKDRVVRVSGEGTVSLPFIGVVQVVGMTDKELHRELLRRLEKYMYHPQVSLFLREYRSRQVAVMGAVAKPGLYTLVSGSDTILDMLAAAGGTTDEAASRILFVPAEHVAPGGPSALPASRPIRQVATAPMSPLPKQADPIVVDLKAFGRGEYQTYLTTPTRPGDIILVPNAGQVLVEGWVDKPGAYKITSELTVLGAVAAAGGPLYPADTNTVKVIRTGKEDGKVVLVADLEKIKRAAEPDIPVRAGDVIEVSSSAAKMVPYGLYRFISGVLNFGASVPLR